MDPKSDSQSTEASASASGNKHVVEDYDSFENMGISENLLRGIFSYGFEKPSIIQQKAIVPFSKGHDIIAQAQSGTGKTATYVVGILQQIEEKRRETQALILVPTIPLAKQVANVVKCLSMHLDITNTVCVGGTNMQDSMKELKQGVQVVTGTPGRVFHMIDIGVLDTTHVKVFALDEADEMLSKGFEDVIKDIFRTLPEEVQVGLFSATLPEECLDLSKRFMRDPINILVKKEELTLAGITQFYVNCDRQDYKYEVLCELYADLKISQAVIFVNTKRGVDWLTNQMTREHHTVSSIHSGLSPEERDAVMKDFRTAKSRVLISTDLLARGIDVQGVSVVINYDLPRNKENYLHRVGRSGRFGRKGLAINLIGSPAEMRDLKDLERFYETQIDAMPADIKNYL
eukprot:TRINITY_DN16167_c0_g1_i1.p1 TRINITY_DN16167_c0_g1~~TRINITY_DN16167_c0_g1_i1.p1  ORF type:complete len:402 (-),score=83.71 TRINITY_DN16167_c0_g1_i1:134-1339(-)